MAGQKAGYTGRAGLGPWTQLLDQARRLQILAGWVSMSRCWPRPARCGPRWANCPPARAGDETVNPWNVREAILDTGRNSALALGGGSSAWT